MERLNLAADEDTFFLQLLFQCAQFAFSFADFLYIQLILCYIWIEIPLVTTQTELTSSAEFWCQIQSEDSSVICSIFWKNFRDDVQFSKALTDEDLTSPYATAKLFMIKLD